MKQKPDETLDQWVRQTLSQLPDAPPPGSPFDSERLWPQVRSELQAAPTRRKIGLGWWIAAACLAGSMLGWFWMHQATADRKTVIVHKIDRKSDVPIVNRSNPDLVAKAVSPNVISKKKHRLIVSLKIPVNQQESLEQKPELLRIEAKPQTIELPVVAEASPVVDKSVERSKPNVAATSHKRRFRVVHENELQAEEEARPKLYRTDHFVRIGTGERSEPTSSETHPALRLPLTQKPNQ
ncbi:hypothetical protein BH09BAC4_BH09BAC4_00490 [soil metagenome]